jgi:signal transduction histidine kinase
MRVPGGPAPAPPPPWQRIVRILLTGVAAALLVFAFGRVAERLVLGGGDADARVRAQAELQASFDAMARALRTIAGGLADAQSVVAAARDDVTAARRLFAAADAALAGNDDGELALTAYATDGRALAWSGRPSELPVDRLLTGEAWFFARGALGLRLVYVTPVVSADGTRVGTIAAERSLGTGATRPVSDADIFRYPTRVAPVSLALRFESGGTTTEPAFDVTAPTGDRLLTASIAAADLERTRQRWRRATASLAVIALAIAVVLLSGPLLDWRSHLRRPGPWMLAAGGIAAVVIAARLLVRLASPAGGSQATLFSGADYASTLFPPLMTSPFDFLLTAITAGGLVALLLFAVEAWRVHLRHVRRPVAGAGRTAAYATNQLGAGLLVAVVLTAYYALLRDTVANTTLDLMHFSVHPFEPGRLALQIGLIVWHATVFGAAVLILRAALTWWSVPRGVWRLRVATVGFWALPLVVWQLAARMPAARQMPLLIALGAAVALVSYATRIKARYRHGSQAFRLIMSTLGLVVPAVVFYPSVCQLAWQAKSQLVETRYAPQAVNQRQTIQRLLQESLAQIDRFPGLADFVTVPPSAAGTADTDRAFQVWRATSLESYPVTSSVELFGREGLLISRFAFNLPDDLTAVPRSEERACMWDVYEEVSPFFAEERRVLHAGRAVCGAGGRPLGSIVVHATLDYANLPFILSRSPYVELMRPSGALRDEGMSGRDVEFAVYGWSRTPQYASGVRAWPLDDGVFARIEQGREPLWADLRRGEEQFDVYILNDRGGIYALGFPVLSALEHVVNLAEVTVLAWVTCAGLLGVTALFGAFSRRGTTARALMREIRASFYRKLLLAFIAATVVPVVALAIATRNYVADEIRANVEQEALRTAAAARRVVEDLVTPRAAQGGVGVDDNLMVWVSRLIDQDVNIFRGPRLLATSERNLFASGLLPTRTPADVYRALELQNEAATVTREQVRGLEPYLLAATSITTRQLDNAVLTVPLTSREQEIEEQIDTLDRRVLLGALLFVLGGAAIGYWLAERIADPVNRLTRATARLARGDLDVRVAATSGDELRRLVQDFNGMALELQRQQKALERTHRLEAWAEMARQVAHEIKNPLTPIQLNAEHLRRVHADRGGPMSPVLDDCVSTILTQVRLLRQIASEFSNFASSPTARPARVEVPPLVHEAVDPYRAGVGDRIRFEVDVPLDLPSVHVDRTLIARSLTNIVENALAAMPGGGSLRVVARAVDATVRIRVSDTGVGMDAEALARAFEPYFSTKSTGTGLGLPIAKRNIELSGGTIAVTSARDRGTTVELTLPAQPHAAASEGGSTPFR